MRIAIIGNGSIGQRHARDALSLGHKVKCYDTRRERSDWAEPEDIWDWNPQVMMICTPPGNHRGWAQSAAIVGDCHLFIEKPLGHSLEGWPELADLCARRGRATHVACPLRYVAEVQAMWQNSAAEAVYAFAERAYHLPTVRPDYLTGYYGQTGVVLEMGSHALDLLQWFFGPARVLSASIGHTGAIGPGCDDWATVEFQHAGGRKSGFSASWLNDKPWHVELLGNVWGSSWTMGDNIDAAYVAELAAFVEACEGKREPDNPLPEAIGTLKTLLEARAHLSRTSNGAEGGAGWAQRSQ